MCRGMVLHSPIQSNRSVVYWDDKPIEGPYSTAKGSMRTHQERQFASAGNCPEGSRLLRTHWGL